jgi:hypothetical protein
VHPSTLTEHNQNDKAMLFFLQEHHISPAIAGVPGLMHVKLSEF